MNMNDSQFGKTIIIFSVVSIACLATLINIEIQNAILPKFISASYKDHLTLEFNSVFLKSLYNIIMKLFFEKPSVTTLLVGDLPFYDLNKKGNKCTNNQIDENSLIQNIISKNNYTKILMSNNNNYHLFPNSDKTKMNVLSFSLEKKTDAIKEDFNSCFTKLSSISLFEIPIDNFVINYQDEYKLESAFFKLKWKLNIPGIIIKYAFSNDYNYLAIVYKNIYTIFYLIKNQ